MHKKMNCQIQRIFEMPLFVNHQSLMIVFVLDGECKVKRFSSIDVFKEGDVFFINPHEVVSIVSSSGCIVEWIEMNIALLNHDENDQLHILGLTDSLGSLDQEKEMADVYRDCVFTKNLLLYALNKENEEIFYEIKEALISDYHDMKDHLSEDQMMWVLNLHHMIYENLNQKISLQELAEHLKMKKSNLATQYKQLTGRTLLEWVNLQRLKKAEELLMFKDDSHQEILKQCGFSDSKYFYRYFMEEFNMTPSAWKEQMKSYQNEKVHLLGEKEAQYYLHHMMEQLSGLKTETELYRKAVLIRQLSQHQLLNKDVCVEVDLLHPDNYIEAYDERINAWYGFDLMMNELNKNPFKVELRIHLDDQRKQDEIDEVFTLLKQSSQRFASKVVKNWSFVIVFNDVKQMNFAKQIQKRIQKEYPHLGCTIKCR